MPLIAGRLVIFIEMDYFWICYLTFLSICETQGRSCAPQHLRQRNNSEQCEQDN